MDHLQDLSSQNCPKLRPGKPKQCRCLEILNNNDAFKEAVCSSLLKWHDSSKEEQDQALLTARVYSQNTEDMLKKATGKVLKSSQFSYKIPFDNPDGTLENASALMNTNICSYAFCHLHNMGRKRWSNICKLAKNCSTVPKHGNTGNKHNAMSPEKLERVHNHLKMLENMASEEPRATRFVRHMNGMTTSTTVRGAGEKDDLYLPSSNGYRPTYYRYCADLGYTVRNRGKETTYQWVGEGDEPEEKPDVSFPKYFYIWKTEYSHLKVKSRSEDICPFCWKYAHAHRYNLSTSALFQLAQDPTITIGGMCRSFEGGRGEIVGGQQRSDAVPGTTEEAFFVHLIGISSKQTISLLPDFASTPSGNSS
eukprot:scaffold27608_cov73-Cyclotella_meneghiniana.AAC.6